MILSPRGAKVDRKNSRKRRQLFDPPHVERKIEALVSKGQMGLHDVFSDEDIHQLCDEMGITFRQRAFTPAVTLGLFVDQALSRDNACSTMATHFNQQRRQLRLSPVCSDASAYCKARSRLPIALIDRLNEQIVEKTQAKTPDDWKWFGRDVYLVDGLVLRAPDTLKNQIAYPQPSSQEDGLGFPQVRVIVTTSLATGCILHYNTGQVEGKQTGEVSLFREKHGDFKPGDIVVGDSNFESFHDSVLLNERGVDIVFCINGTRKDPFTGSACRTTEDATVVVKKPKFNPSRFTREQWEKLPDSIMYRVIRYRVPGRNTEITIVTTLLDRSKYSARDVAELYGLRWEVELDVCSYKATMGMGELRCQTPENLDREIAVGILAFNLVRLLMSDTATVLNVHPREISFSHARDAWIVFGKQLETPKDLMWIVLAASARLVRNRPGREEPRATKKRGQSKYPKLKEPRPSRARRQSPPDKKTPAQPPGVP